MCDIYFNISPFLDDSLFAEGYFFTSIFLKMYFLSKLNWINLYQNTILVHLLQIYFLTFLCSFLLQSMRFKDQSHNNLRKEDELYIMIFFVIVILRVVGTVRYGIAISKTINRSLYEKFSSTDMVLLHIQSVGDSAQAFCNCILFCIRDTEVRRELWNRIRRSRWERQPLFTELMEL